MVRPGAVPGAGERSIVLELARAREGGDPFAFRLDAEAYLVRQDPEGSGGSYRAVEVPWGQGLLDELTRARDSPEARQRVGDRLRAVLEPAGWERVERALLEATREHPLVLTIRAAAAELLALPWELITTRGTGQHLAELTGCVLRYEWPGAAAREPSVAVSEPRIVFAWSSAGGAVPAEAQRDAIATACAAAKVAFDPSRDVVEALSGRRLSEALSGTERPASVLHILCHGSGDGLLWDSDDAGAEGPARIDGASLRRLLQPHAGALELVVLSACASADPGPLGGHLGSVAQGLHRAGVARAVVASRYPLSARGSQTLTGRLYAALLPERRSLEGALVDARAALLRDPEGLDWASIQLYGRADEGADTRPVTLRPYRGLLSFEAEHEGLFFGRGDEIDTLVTRVEAAAQDLERGFQLVLGTSGSGKSSLVRAGVIPRLRASGGWRFAVMRPGDRGGEPVEALAAALADAHGSSAGDPATAPAEGRTLLFVDQFEEVFTHVDPALAGAFATQLWQLAQRPDTVVMATMRVDMLARCDGLPIDGEGARFSAIAYDEGRRVLLGPPSLAAMRAIIERPAAAVGLELQAGLARQIIADVDGRPGALPLLQHALDSLWQAREGRTLTLAAYRQLGGVAGALTRTADAVIDAAPPEERAEARRLLLALVDLDGDSVPRGRRRVNKQHVRPADVASTASFDRALTRLIEGRLVVEADGTLELSHEALIGSWERLRAWLEEDREVLGELRRLEALCDAWSEREDHPDDQVRLLLTGERLERARGLLEAHPGQLSARARDFIAEGEWRTQARRRRAFAYKSGIALSVLIGCSAYGLGVGANDDANIAVAIIVTAAQFAFLWELSVAERVDVVSIIDGFAYFATSSIMIGLAYLSLDASTALEHPAMKWLLAGLVVPRLWSLARLARLLPPQRRRWVFLSALPRVLALTLWVAALFVESQATVTLWLAALAVEGWAVQMLVFTNWIKLPPILSEGFFIGAWSRLQEMALVAIAVVAIVGVARGVEATPDGWMLVVVGSCFFPVFASAGHFARHEPRHPGDERWRYVWFTGMLLIMFAHVFAGGAVYQIAASGGAEPAGRDAWSDAVSVLLLGVIFAVTSEGLWRTRRGPRLRLLALVASIIVVNVVSAWTLHASTHAWALSQWIVLLACMVHIPVPFTLRGRARLRAARRS